MKFVLFRLISNSKWFFSSWLRSLIGSIALISYFIILIAFYNPAQYIHFLSDSLITILFGLAFFATCCRVIGWGLSKYVPNPDWSYKNDKLTFYLSLTILLIPTFFTIWMVIMVDPSEYYNYQLIGVISSSTPISILGIYLLLRVPYIPSKDEYENYNNYLMNLKSNKDQIIKRLKTTTVILSVWNLLVLCYLIFSFVRQDELEDRLNVNKWELKDANEEIQRLNQIIQDSQISTDSIN